ncbi:MAG: glycoside hydrolase family 65 protein [Bacteroidetes bacterium]|nr:glycoside hydrolase family 65 protein [Bacteroidota bacterium]
MKNYIVHHPWQIIEEGYNGHYNLVSESLMSIGNGRMGLRGNHEETFSGPTLKGTYLAGIYYPDKTRVGWWKNGYPEYFAKVLNNIDWLRLNLEINGEQIDLAKVEITHFKRTLDMKRGILYRSATFNLGNGTEVNLESERFCSIVDLDLACLKYAITTNRNCEIKLSSSLSFDVKNQDSNYDETFWELAKITSQEQIAVSAKTKKTGFEVAASCVNRLVSDDMVAMPTHSEHHEKTVTDTFVHSASAGQKTTLYKICSIKSSFYYGEDLMSLTTQHAKQKWNEGYDALKQAHADAWQTKWQDCDIEIEGDVAAQQGIRFNIFQLYQTFSGEDHRLNIGPKGFTGEKYGGSTYWDTEAYCLPFYLATADEKIARQLLVYRYKQLQKAIENAEKLGFTNGAALYPMVTINGEECHNEWEITFEEIHRNAAIAYAIFHYNQYTGTADYLLEGGLEVLIAIARFWAQRVNWSTSKNQYVMLGVTGPNEFENNVNNNWYTNYAATWCMRYTMEALKQAEMLNGASTDAIIIKVNLQVEELEKWTHIIENIHLPSHPENPNIRLQQEGFLDKELIPVSELPESQRPIVEHWSWDRILRSVYIKQGDVMQGIYFFENEFTTKEIKDNFDFYEQFTVHESSLSPCIHSVLAAKIGNEEKAYEYYLRTARLDLDDYNNDTRDGCHITSMAGSWLSVVQGFAGMRIKGNTLSFSSFVPKKWEGYSFNIIFRGAKIQIKVAGNETHLTNHSEGDLKVLVYDKEYTMEANKTLSVARNS